MLYGDFIMLYGDVIFKLVIYWVILGFDGDSMGDIDIYGYLFYEISPRSDPKMKRSSRK